MDPLDGPEKIIGCMRIREIAIYKDAASCPQLIRFPFVLQLSFPIQHNEEKKGLEIGTGGCVWLQGSQLPYLLEMEEGTSGKG